MPACPTRPTGCPPVMLAAEVVPRGAAISGATIAMAPAAGGAAVAATKGSTVLGLLLAAADATLHDRSPRLAQACARPYVMSIPDTGPRSSPCQAEAALECSCGAKSGVVWLGILQHELRLRHKERRTVWWRPARWRCRWMAPAQPTPSLCAHHTCTRCARQTPQASQVPSCTPADDTGSLRAPLDHTRMQGRSWQCT